jgi:hypothetical protein
MGNSPDIISAFESAMSRIGAFRYTMASKGSYNGCHINSLQGHVTTARTDHTLQTAIRHRGPVHNGRMELTVRTYVMTR